MSGAAKRPRGLRILGIPVQVQVTFFVVGALIFPRPALTDWLAPMVIWLVAMASGVLLHEFGHALAGRAYGLAPRIILHGFGGLTAWQQGRALSPAKGMVVGAAGPAVGIAIGLLTMGLSAAFAPEWEAMARLRAGPLDLAALSPARAASVPEYLALSVVWVNLGWGVLNLVPMLPLDGGNILAGAFEWINPRRGRAIARVVSVAVAASVVLWAFREGYVVMALLVAWLSWENVRAVGLEWAVAPDRPLLERVREGHAQLARGDIPALVGNAQDLLSRATTAPIRAEVAQLLAWGHLLAGRPRDAQAALESMPAARPPHPGLLGAVLLENGRSSEAVEPLILAMRQEPTDFVEASLMRAFVESRRFRDALLYFDAGAGRDAQPLRIFEVEKAAFDAADFETAAELGELLFRREGKPVRAYNVACSRARAGDLERSMTWLRKAIDGGFDDHAALNGDTDLAALRAHPEWRQLLQRLGEKRA